jgi:hypothetical protein
VNGCVVFSDVVCGDLRSPRTTIFLLGNLIFKGLTARRLYKSFGVKGLIAFTRFEHLFVHHRETLCVSQLAYFVLIMSAGF